jgi:hypothetical protein
VLGSWTKAGTASSNGDNSAIFIGIRSDSTDINKIVFSLDDGGNGSTSDFGINRFDFNAGPAAAVPEPASLTLLASAPSAWPGTPGGGSGCLPASASGWRQRRGKASGQGG